MPISGLLFDLDGTLLETEPGILASFRHTLQTLGLPPRSDAQLRTHIGPPLKTSWGELVGAELTDRATEIYRQFYDAKGKFMARPYGGMLEALAQLSTSYRLFIATSKRKVFALDMAEHFGLRPYFAEVYGLLPENLAEDKAALIARILLEQSLNPQETLMIGDRLYDLTGAKANGLGSIGVLWGYGSRGELQTHHPTALCERPADLPSIISDLALGAKAVSSRD